MNARLYSTLDAQLQGRCRDSRKLANHTYLRRGSLVASPDVALISVRLWDTNVVTVWPNGTVCLNTGGYNTLTTRDRINTFLREYASLIGNHGAPYRLATDRGILTLRQPADVRAPDYWSRDSVVCYVQRECSIGPRGKIVTDARTNYSARAKILKAQIAEYAQACAAAVPLPLPSGGDCWFCYMFERVERAGKLPAHISREHLLSHISKRERYIVPTLVWNALTFCGAGPAFFAAAFGSDERGSWLGDILRDTVRRDVRRYVSRCLQVG